MDIEKQLRIALKIELPYSNVRKLPEGIRVTSVSAAVMVLVGMDQEIPKILFTKRSESVETHKGQISFPGGRVDPEEEGLPFSQVALRELEEEVGISSRLVRPLGELPHLPTLSSATWVAPVVGVLLSPVSEVDLKISEAEVSDAKWISIEELLAPGNHRREIFEAKGMKILTDIFEVSDYYIWGATGAMLRNLLDRLLQTRGGEK